MEDEELRKKNRQERLEALRQNRQRQAGNASHDAVTSRDDAKGNGGKKPGPPRRLKSGRLRSLVQHAKGLQRGSNDPRSKKKAGEEDDEEEEDGESESESESDEEDYDPDREDVQGMDQFQRPIVPPSSAFQLFDLGLIHSNVDPAIENRVYIKRENMDVWSHLLPKQVGTSTQKRYAQRGLFIERKPVYAPVLLHQPRRTKSRLVRDVMSSLARAMDEGMLHDQLKRDHRSLDLFDEYLSPRICENPIVDGLYRKNRQHFTRPAEKENIDSERECSDIEGKALLEICVSRLALYDHPLFCKEDELCSIIKMCYGEYHRIIKTKRRIYLYHRLLYIIDGLERFREYDLENDDVESEGFQAFLKTFSVIYDECCDNLAECYEVEQKVRALSKTILKKWKTIKEDRNTKGYRATSLRVVAKKVVHHIDAGDDITSLEDILARLDDLLEWAEELHRSIVATETMGANSPRHGSELQRSTSLGSSTSSRCGSLLTKCVSMVQKISTTVEYAVRVTDTDSVSTNFATENGENAERRRREKIENLRAFCVLRVNDKKVATTSVQQCRWPTFVVDFHQVFRFAFSKVPDMIRIEIYMERRDKMSFAIPHELIASIPLPIPGVQPTSSTKLPTHGLSPLTSWLQFSAYQDFRGRRIKGAVLVGVQWDVHPLGRGEQTKQIIPVLPGTSADRVRATWTSPRGHAIKKRFIGSHMSYNRGFTSDPLDTDKDTMPEFARERDFLSLLPPIDHLDPNDPRNRDLLRFKNLLLPSEASSDAFRTFEFGGILGRFSNWVMFKSPLRHQLLRLRVEKRTLSSLQIPVLESDIRKDKKCIKALEEFVAKRSRKYQRESRGEKRDSDDPTARMNVDSSRIQDFLERVRESHSLARNVTSQEKQSISTIVKEVSFFDPMGFTFSIKDFIPEPKRALRPHIKVIAAKNLPLRKGDYINELDNAALSKQAGRKKKSNRKGRSHKKKGGKKSNARDKKKRQLGSAGPHSSDSEGGSEAASSSRDSSPAPSTTGDVPEAEVEQDEEILSTFVEISFDGKKKRTSSVEGRSPLWKETIEVDVNSPDDNDFSPSKMSQIREDIFVSLFDEVVEDDRDLGGFYDDESSTRRERRYLGSLTIPFSFVYMKSQREERGSNVRVDSSTQGAEGETGHRRRDHNIYLKMYMTLDPILLTPSKDQEGGILRKIDMDVAAYANRWLQVQVMVSRCTKDRLYDNYTDCQVYKCVHTKEKLRGTEKRKVHSDAICCQIIDDWEQEPPPGINTIEKCAYFVSLIPFIEDWQMLEGGGIDMWYTTQQFLDILAGDWEEHAMVLRNYMQYILDNEKSKGVKWEVYLAVGSAIPEGDSIYVLQRKIRNSESNEPRQNPPTTGKRRESSILRSRPSTSFNSDDEILLWNASTGKNYSPLDPLCPLQDIWYLVSPTNILANIQINSRPWELSFDLENPKLWKPFFNQKFRVKKRHLVAVQDVTLRYTRPSRQLAMEVEASLHEALKTYIRRWRSRQVLTTFNADVSNRLRELLPSMEKWKQGDLQIQMGEHHRKLRHILKNRNMHGLPMHFAYTDIESITKKVEATAIHENKHPQVQFALAVSVYPYSNNVLSVWVYLASLTPRT